MCFLFVLIKQNFKELTNQKIPHIGYFMLYEIIKSYNSILFAKRIRLKSKIINQNKSQSTPN